MMKQGCEEMFSEHRFTWNRKEKGFVKRYGKSGTIIITQMSEDFDGFYSLRCYLSGSEVYKCLITCREVFEKTVSALVYLYNLVY